MEISQSMLAVGVGLVLLWLVFRALASRWTWNLLILALIAAGVAYGWPGVVTFFLVSAVLVRLFLSGSGSSPSTYTGPAIRDIIERQDRFK